MAPATQEREAELVQHASRRNTRYTAQAVVDGTRRSPSARTDHDELVDLIGATRVDAGNVCLLRVWGDPHMAPDRIDLAKIKDDDDDEVTKTSREGADSFQWFHDVEQMGCGVDHVIWLRAGRVWGIGNTWNSQVVRRWHKKPSKCLIRFSKPARVDLAGCPVDEEEEEKQEKKDYAKKNLHTGDVASGAEKRSDRETDGTVSRPKEQKVKHLPQKATAVAASRHETCVAYEGELHWSIPRGYREQVFRCIKLRNRVIKIALHKGSKAQRGGILLTATREALRLRLSPFASDGEKEAEVESPEGPARKIEPILDLVADNVDHVGATEDAIVYVQGSKVSYVGSESCTFDVEEDVFELACGLHHSVLLTNERRRVLTWGSNRVGALGLSKSTCLQGGDYKTPQLVNGRLGPFWEKCERVKHVCAGGNYSGFLLEDGRVFLCGELAAGAKLVLRPQLFEIPPYFQVQRLWAGDEYLILQCDAKQDVDGL